VLTLPEAAASDSMIRPTDRQPIPVSYIFGLKERLEDLFRLLWQQSYLDIADRNQELIISSYF